MSEWYEVVGPDAPLTQGDIILRCPVPMWKGEGLEVSLNEDEQEVLKNAIDFISADVVVLTQACDLEHAKVSNATLCPNISLNDYRSFWEESMKESGSNPTEKAWKKQCEILKDGYQWNLSLLNQSTGLEITSEYRVVDFHDVFTVPIAFLESLMRKRGTKRLRLKPPYREHLSQAFARYYMRVGLPIDIRTKDLTDTQSS